MTNKKRMYWAYLHQSGHIHVKRYWGGYCGQATIADAHNSPFVVEVVDPFEANYHHEAVAIASAKLRPAPASPQTAADVQAQRLAAFEQRMDDEDNAPRRQHPGGY